MFKILKNEKGIGFVEVLMALALLGIIAATFLMAIGVAARAILIADERTTAESLVKSQMEYIMQQPYNEPDETDEDINGDGLYNEAIYSEIDISGDPQYSSFNIGSIVEVNGTETAIEQIVGVSWNTITGEHDIEDRGIQMVKLIVCNNGDDGVSLDDYILILEDFKVDKQ